MKLMQLENLVRDGFAGIMPPTPARIDTKHLSVKLDDRRIANLKKLAAYLCALPSNQFDMRHYVLDAAGQEVSIENWECGTVACAVGHGPAAGVAIEDEEGWIRYAQKAFTGWGQQGDHIFSWLFSDVWAIPDNTPIGAAKRIVYMLEYGIPMCVYEETSDIDGVMIRAV